MSYIIRDRIIVGIQDAQLSEKMQMEPELTLERAVTLARQSEGVKTQQPTVRGELLQESTIEAVHATTRQQKGQNRLPSAQSNQPPSQRAKKSYGRCGRPGHHSQAQCPARESIFHKCDKLGHFKSVCRGVLKRSGVREVETGSTNILGTIYSSNVSAVETNKWTKTLSLNQRDILTQVLMSQLFQRVFIKVHMMDHYSQQNVH